MKILVFGNPLVEKDNLALKLLPKLQEQFPELEFKEADPTENLEQETENKQLVILDVAEGIDNVFVFEDIDKLETIKSCSMHDFDLAYNLKVLKKMNLIDAVKIIAIPIGMKEENAFNEVSRLLNSLFNKS